MVSNIGQFKARGLKSFHGSIMMKRVTLCFATFVQTSILKVDLATARCSDGAFISNGFSNWKKALQKFKEHQTSECHKLAVDHEIVLPNTNHTIVDL